MLKSTNDTTVIYHPHSPDSLANVEVQWAKEVKHFCKGVPVILVGNKIDLRGDKDMIANLAKKDQVCYHYVNKYFGIIYIDY